MKVSPHTHVESPLTGSTILSMLTRAKELGRTHIVYTDHGHLSSALKVGRVMKEEEKKQKMKFGLKVIQGIEFYFKDTSCPIVSSSGANRCKYFSAALYCKDQAAFQALCLLVSRIDLPTLEIREETQQMWSWKELEEMAKYNVNIVLSGVHCMVGKTMLAGHPAVGDAVLSKLIGIYGKERVNLALVCEPWSKKYTSLVQISYADGTSDTCLSTDQVTTERARRIKVTDLLESNRHSVIRSISTSGMFKQVEKRIESVKLHKGFLPFPGGDVTAKLNRYYLALGKKHSVGVLATDYAYYATPGDRVVQTMRLEGADKIQASFHMKSEEEIVAYLRTLGLPEEACKNIVSNNDEWVKQFNDLSLKYEWRLADSGPDPLKQAMEIIKQNGRMKWDDPVWVDRLREELNVIAKNGVKDLTAYFLPIRNVLNHYLENGQLTGPGRGSAGGSLFCYLLGITQVNPFEYDLPFSRFFSMDRIKSNKLPDIDVDLENRELLVGLDNKSGYLYGTYGDKAAQISTRTTVRLKSAVKDTNRYFHGKVEDSIEVFTKGLPAPPQGISDHAFVFGFEDEEGHETPGLLEQSAELKSYIETRPKEWDIVNKAMGLTRSFSKHASAFVLCDIPIKEVVPTKEGYITQYEAKECEAAGLIKYDFLVIHQLRDIRVCMDLIKKKAGRKDLPVTHFPHGGADTFVWDLPKDGQVFRSIWSGQTETCFQINTRSMIPFVMEICPESIMDVANILALVRPGPMDFIDELTGRNMVEEYVLRRRGQSTPDIKELADLLPETYGIITFQEQLNKIARQIAGFSGEEAEKLRENMAKKKMEELMAMKPAFISGSMERISKETAEAIWERMVTFGRYGFSIIHAVEYAMVTYACMFFKHYYPLEWWAAVLTNATEQEITGKFWPYVKDTVLPPDINLSSDTMVVDYANNKIRAKLGVMKGMGDATMMPIVEGRPYATVQDFIDKDVAGNSLSHKLIHVGVLDSLFPPKANLLEKLKIFEDAVEVKLFRNYLKQKEKDGKKGRLTQPKEGRVPSEYINLHPMVDAAMKKAVLPSLPINTHELGVKYSKVLVPFKNRPMVLNSRGYDTLLIDGAKLQKLDEIEGDEIEKDIYVASTCYIIKAEEFTFAKNTKRALKLIIDSDGYVSEKVLWPDFESGELMYPKELKKGAIATLFFRKKAGKKDMSINSVVVESVTDDSKRLDRPTEAVL